MKAGKDGMSACAMQPRYASPSPWSSKNTDSEPSSGSEYERAQRIVRPAQKLAAREVVFNVAAISVFNQPKVGC